MSQHYCRSCKAPVRWVRMVNTGRAMPLDAEPDPKGTIRLLGDGRAEVLSVAARRVFAGGLYISHFATCAFADEHRR